MYNSMSVRASKTMRAFGLGLAVALLVALICFVSYKSNCVSCSTADAPAFAACTTCSGCGKDKNSPTDQPEVKSVDIGEEYVDPEHEYVDIDVEIDGKVVHLTVDLDSETPNSTNFANDDDTVKGAVETGIPADDVSGNKKIKLVINSTEKVVYVPASNSDTPDKPVEPAVDPAAEKQSNDGDQTVINLDVNINGLNGNHDAALGNTGAVQGDSDIAAVNDAAVVDVSVSDSDEKPELNVQLNGLPLDIAPVVSGKNDVNEEQNNIMTAQNTLLAPVSLLEGEAFGMEGKVLALSKGSQRRDVIVAVVAPEGKTVALLCERLATKKTIDAVAANYPKKVVYTYTIDREFFVNLRGESYFELYNFNDEVQLQSGMETPEWLKATVNPIPDSDLDIYRIKNQLESAHVCGTKGCLVIAESNDIFRYNWDKCAHYEV